MTLVKICGLNAPEAVRAAAAADFAGFVFYPASPRNVDAGAAARLAAERFPTAEVVGVDVSPGMIEVADARTPPPLADRVTFLVADAAALPLPSGSCELALLANMIPFFDELDRVLAPAGDVLVSFSFGPRTPIYVPPDRLRHELAARGFTHFADFSAGPAVCLHARRGDARL